MSYERAKVKNLVTRGARLSVHSHVRQNFIDIGLNPEFETEEAIERATVVIDCTPKGIGHENKHKYYEKFAIPGKGYLAQGSEDGFGLKYARSINDKALKKNNNQFVQVVSCNTHTIASLTNTIAITESENNLLEGRFVCIRRASDISQTSAYIPAPEVGRHNSDKFGTHHAQDASHVLQTMYYYLKIYSSAMKINSQYMHAIRFSMTLKEKLTAPDVIERFREDQFVTLTRHKTANKVFSYGRDHGFYGRIYNQVVINRDSVHVMHTNPGETKVMGFAFTPQDGNSLLSSAVAVLRGLHGEKYIRYTHELSHLLRDNV